VVVLELRVFLILEQREPLILEEVVEVAALLQITLVLMVVLVLLFFVTLTPTA
jgi:hypothetical protein